MQQKTKRVRTVCGSVRALQSNARANTDSEENSPPPLSQGLAARARRCLKAGDSKLRKRLPCNLQRDHSLSYTVSLAPLYPPPRPQPATEPSAWCRAAVDKRHRNERTRSSESASFAQSRTHSAPRGRSHHGRRHRPHPFPSGPGPLTSSR